MFLDICVKTLRSCTCLERLPWHAEEPNVAKQLVWKIFTRFCGTYCIYICCFFRFDAIPRELFVSFYYFFFFFCLAAMVFQVNTTSIQYFWIFSDIQLKYSRRSTISLHNTYFALQYWQPYLFSNFSYQQYGLFFRFFSSQYVNLILWEKVYVAFNDLHILKIVSVMWMKNKL